MELRYIEPGTQMDIQIISAEDSRLLSGVFVDTERGASFYITCDELFDRFDELYRSCKLHFTFYRGSDVYSFSGLMDDTRSKDRVILATATSVIEKTSRRKAPRIEMGISAEIFGKTPGGGEGPLLVGTTNNISTTGLSLFAQDKVALPDGQYVAEFTLIQPEKISLPVKFIRMGDAPQSVQYRYDYAFLFDCENDSEGIRNLTLSLFRYKMKGS